MASLRGERSAFVVMHDNWESFELFLHCNRQWSHFPSGQLQCLDRAAVRAVMNMLGVPDQCAALADIELIELGALHAFRGKPVEDLERGERI